MIPSDKKVFVSQPMDILYMGVAIPLTHILEVRIGSWLPPISSPPDLVMTILLPNEVQHLIMLINQDYLDTLPSIPAFMEERTPNLAPDTLPISCLAWNVQGAGSQTFISALKDLVRNHQPNVLPLVETHMGGTQALKIASILGYSGHTRVDAMGFSGGIWVYWRPDLVTVEPILKHQQHITMEIKRIGVVPWYFSAVNASRTRLSEEIYGTNSKNFPQHTINLGC